VSKAYRKIPIERFKRIKRHDGSNPWIKNHEVENVALRRNSRIDGGWKGGKRMKW